MRPCAFLFYLLLCLEVADVLVLVRVEREVANRSHQAVNAERNHRKEKVRQRSRLKALGF